MARMRRNYGPQVHWKQVKAPDRGTIDNLVQAHIREIVLDALPGMDSLEGPDYDHAAWIIECVFASEPFEDFVLRKAAYRPIYVRKKPSYVGRSMNVYNKLVRECAERLQVAFPQYKAKE
ncbi:hypothetical protein HY497_00370 [Candidatus Woesearchaeota archaeon]|nr:hypothetical protein [Candidatus Woesearchaeota archaeon]